MGYTIKVLNNDEFDSLPYAKVKTSLGLADPATDEVFVRNTGIKELNEYLLDHELNHLVEEVPTDEFDGIRYKDLGGIFNSIGGGIKSGVGALGSGLGNVASGIGSGLSSFGSNFGSAFNKNPNPVNSAAQSTGSGIMGLFNPKSILGAGLLGAGLLKGFPKAPQNPQSINDLRTQVQGGGSPLGQQAQSNLGGILSEKFNPLSDEEIKSATAENDRNKQLAIKRLQDVYANARPGTSYSEDGSYLKDVANIEHQYSQDNVNNVTNLTRNAQTTFNTRQQQAIQQSLGASDSQMSQLASLAQQDVNQIMTKLQLDYAAAVNFKQTFQNLGSNLLLSGFGVQTNPFAGFGGGTK